MAAKDNLTKKGITMNLSLTYKKVFGNDLYYPADETGATLCLLIGSKSFAPWQVEAMRKAGWVLDVKGAMPG